jgi:hypothetical protein
MPESRRDVFAVASLYAIQLTLILSIVAAANRQQLLTKEEVTSAFVCPSFLQLRLQHHVFSTNFYNYLFFSITGDIFRNLYFARFTKAVVMAFLPPLIYLYLRRRFSVERLIAFFSAMAIGFLPGVVCFSWMGIEIGSDTLLAFFALFLALFENSWAIATSLVVAAIAAGFYGSAFIFIPIVLLQQLLRFKQPQWRPPIILGVILMIAVMLFPIFWWTNVQTLFLGGGRPAATGAITRLAALGRELFLKGDSYYFFSNGAPAFGTLLIGLVSVAALIYVATRQPSKSWPLLAIAAGTLAVYAIAGNVPGVRRVIPLIVSLGMFAAVAFGMLARNRTWGIAACLLLLASIAFELRADSGIRTALADSRITLPRDFDFRIPEGETMESTLRSFIAGSRKVPDPLEGYEPDRTLALLYRLTQPHPIVSSRDLVAACDGHGWSIPSTKPRLARLLRRQ